MAAPVPARPSIASRSPVVALDVTVRFNDAASALETGQLVKQDDFTLFEAVSALEVRASSIKLLYSADIFRGPGSENGPRVRRGSGRRVRCIAFAFTTGSHWDHGPDTVP
jgi:hypothetical protein